MALTMTLKHPGEQKTILIPETIDGEISIRLSWTKDNSAKFLQRILGGDTIDLDLGCYYELDNGSRTLIDCLQFATDDPAPRNVQSKQGCYDHEPYIWHTGDDTGRSKGDSEEELLVNPIGLQHLKCITVYTYIFDGPASWDSFGAKITLSIPGCEDISTQIEGNGGKERFCAAMHIEISEDKKTIKVTRLGTFHRGHSDCDQAYGWSLQYRQP